MKRRLRRPNGVLIKTQGVTATTWVQITKAALLLAGASLMAFMVMARVNLSPEELSAARWR